MSDVDLPVEVGADLLNHPNTSEIGIGVQLHQRLAHSIRKDVDFVWWGQISSTFEQVFLSCVFAGSMLLDQDAEFIVGEVGNGSDRVDRRCSIVVFGVSPKPDLDVLHILRTSFCMLYLQSALRCVPSVDATRASSAHGASNSVLYESTYHDASTRDRDQY